MAMTKKKRRLSNRRRRALDQKTVIDYKSPETLKRFITERGMIIPRRISGASAKQQRAICTAVKRARYLAIIPYSVAHRGERGFSGMVSMSYSMFDRPHHKFNRDRGGRDNRDRDSRGPRPDARNAAPAPAKEQREAPAADTKTEA
jgi:small subunit ribosomal protein S18